MSVGLCKFTGKKAGIKWVNDIFCGGKKVCGILTEASLDCESGLMNHVIVGIGVNALAPVGGFPEELRDIAKDNLDAARFRLIEILRNYQGFKQSPVILVFDAYKVKGNPGSIEHLGGLDVVYTKEAETADMYIEKATYDLRKKHRVRVATSDALEQVIILGHGALRIPASAFETEVREAEAAIRAVLRELK